VKREWGRRVRHTQLDASVGSAARLRWAPRACSLRPLLHALGGPHFWGHDHDPFRWLGPRSSREAADYGRPWGVVCGTAVLTSGSSTACLVRLRARGGGKLGGGERPRQRVRPSHALGPSCRSVPAAPDLRSSPKWRLTGVR
jgi:hypothetical protein